MCVGNEGSVDVCVWQLQTGGDGHGTRGGLGSCGGGISGFVAGFCVAACMERRQQTKNQIQAEGRLSEMKGGMQAKLAKTDNGPPLLPVGRGSAATRRRCDLLFGFELLSCSCVIRIKRRSAGDMLCQRLGQQSPSREQRSAACDTDTKTNRRHWRLAIDATTYFRVN